MKNVFGKIKLGFFSVLALTFLLMPFFVLADTDPNDAKANSYGVEKVYENSLLSTIGISNSDPLTLAQNIVRIVLGFVGIVMFALVFYAGIVWLKARDNSSEVDKAKNIIENALYGIGIIVLAYAISEFIFSRLIG